MSFPAQAAAILGAIDERQVEDVLDRLRTVRDREGRLFFLRNGGGQGSHAAADFRKIGGIEAYAWGENVHDLTAYVNDEGWACATARWLEDSRCGPDDAIFVMSVGGASREVSANLKEAIFWAKGGPAVLGIVGQNGGYLASSAGIQASWGIVTAINGPTRTFRGGMLDEFIQSETTPYPGFSGGPLINTEGEVLGLNTPG